MERRKFLTTSGMTDTGKKVRRGHETSLPQAARFVSPQAKNDICHSECNKGSFTRSKEDYCI